jgi:phosphoglycolate phosphatase-like HAD superfamily hydrolase
MDIRAVIFDLDNTLIGSLAESLCRIRTLCAMHDIPFTALNRARLLNLWGAPAMTLLTQGLSVTEETADTIHRAWQRYDEHILPPVIPNAHRALSWLGRNGITNCLLTSRHRDNTLTILDRHGLLAEFALVSTVEDTQFHKPDPRAFEYILDKLQKENGVSPSQCLYVGDTIADVVAGRSADITTLAVMTGQFTHLPNLKNAVVGIGLDLADVIPSIAELPYEVENRHDGTLPLSADALGY